MADREHGDALFGPDGTFGDATTGWMADGVGPLPGLDVVAVRLPVIGPDGSVTGLDGFDGDLSGSTAVRPAFEGVARPPIAVPRRPAQPVRPVQPVIVGSEPSAGLGPVPGSETSIRVSPRPAATPSTAGPHPVDPHPPPTRPRLPEEPSILGLTRRSRSRLGSRAFTLFFVLVFALILVQLVVALVSR